MENSSLTWQARRRRQRKREENRIALLRRELQRPGARLVLEHSVKPGHRFFIVPGGLRVTNSEAEALIRRKLVRAHDRGLFADTFQSWTTA